MNITGDLKSLHLLWVNLAKNHRYESLISKADIITFEDRLSNEGLTFLTKALPSIGKALDSFHSTTEWCNPEGFKTLDGLPVFLGKAIKLALSGDSLAVDCVRQLTLVFYKLEVERDEKTDELFLDQFKNTDRDLAHSIDETNSYVISLIDRMKRILGGSCVMRTRSIFAHLTAAVQLLAELSIRISITS